MNRRFNLLPPRYVERVAERRLAGLVAAGLLALATLLALASVVQSRQLAAAERNREVEQARITELQDRRRALAPFRQLADGISGRERLLADAMATQVSWAEVLTSLSATFPTGASLTSMTAESELPAFGAAPVALPPEGRVIGTTTLKGYSVERFTPGVEQLLQRLDAVVGLSEPRLQVGSVEEIGERPVTNFEGTTFLDGTALSGRYAGGLPPENDVEVPRLGSGSGAPAGRARPTS